jgi:glucokinase
MMTTNDFVLAADIGGSHITAALVDITTRQLILPSLVRKPVDANGSAESIITSWSECLSSSKTNVGISKICLAIPGPFDYEKGLSLMQGQGKYDALYKANIKELLAEALNTDPENIFAENDAACFLQGEVFAGCATGGFEKVIGLTLGTGLGTAIYESGKSHSADLWSLPFRNSIAEDYLATRWFLQYYKQQSGKTISGVKALAELAESDPCVKAMFGEFGNNLAHFLFHFIEKEAPEVVVIGGNIANAYKLFQQELEEAMAKEFPSILLKKSLLGEEAALLGAAGSWHSVAQKALFFSH